MKRTLRILTLLMLLLGGSLSVRAQKVAEPVKPMRQVHLTPMCIYEGDTIPSVQLRTVYIFKPIKFKNKRQARRYTRLVRDVKKVLPLAKEINGIIIETYEYLQTLPTKKERDAHIKRVEKSLKEQYMPILRRYTLSQGKLLIKLVDRQTDSTGYELVKAFMGPFRAGFYQTFAALFGASLKKEYDAEGEDWMTEQIILLVESGQL